MREEIANMGLERHPVQAVWSTDASAPSSPVGVHHQPCFRKEATEAGRSSLTCPRKFEPMCFDSSLYTKPLLESGLIETQSPLPQKRLKVG